MNINLEQIQPREIIPGFRGRLVHGKEMSLVFWEVEQGAEVPAHDHQNEQIMHVLEGQFEFSLDGTTRVCQPGDIVLIPSFSTHSGKALTPCRLMDIFSPAREEYR